MRSGLLLIAILVSTMMPSAFAADEPGTRPLVLVACFDAQTYPPQFMPNYTSAIADLVSASLSEAYGGSVDVLESGDWFLLLDAINMPNVVGAVLSITVREGGALHLPAGSADRLLQSFEAGLGLVGIHGPAYSPYFGDISREIFPVDGDDLAGGKINRVGQIVTFQHTHRRKADHFITEGSPEVFEAADSSLIYRQVQEGSWFTPDSGSMTVLYAAEAGNIEVPSVIAYEREKGRSVTFTGLKHTDGRGRYEGSRDWYNHSLRLPEVRMLLGKSIVWAVQPLLEAAALEKRIEDSADHFAERLGLLTPEAEFGSGERIRLVEGSGAKLAVALVVSVLLVIAIAYFGLYRG